ncbi:MAG TPA: hypothetical protein VED01_14210 [Burkholderiales bacterium]|nr:hypothetical protein [Burkholderiales bacterium]
MRSIRPAFFGLALLGACASHSQLDTVIVLRESAPQFAWNSSGAVRLDINRDGAQDAAFLGHDDDVVALGVVLGGPIPRLALLQFRQRGNAQLGVCSEALGLTVERQSAMPELAFGTPVPGYDVCDACFELRVLESEPCDPLYIFWNREVDDLDWWRT